MSLNTRNIVVVNHKQLKELIIHKYLTTIRGIPTLPLFIHGPTGCGKSEVVKEASKQLAMQLNLTYTEDINTASADTFLCLPIYLSRQTPEGLEGVLVPDFKSKTSRKLPFDVLKKLSNPNIAGILFFDEFDQAEPIKQNAVQQILLEHRLGNLRLSPKIMVICAGNGASEGYYATYEIPDNIKTRCTHVFLPPPPIKDWLEWSYQNKIHPDIIAFLTFRPDLLYNTPENAYAISVPRGWSFASNELYALEENRTNIEKWLVVATYVGASAGLAFKAFLDLRADVDPVYYIQNPKEFLELPLKHEKGEELQYALAPSIAKIFAEYPELRKNIITLVITLITGSADPLIHEEVAKLTEKMIRKHDPNISIRKYLTEHYPETEQFRNEELATLILKLCKITAGREALLEAISKHPHSIVLMNVIKLLTVRA